MVRFIAILILVVTSISSFGQWQYNQIINIQSPYDTIRSDFQVRLEINTAELINAGKLQPDGADLRFSPNCAFRKFYSYWIEENINTMAELKL